MTDYWDRLSDIYSNINGIDDELDLLLDSTGNEHADDYICIAMGDLKSALDNIRSAMEEIK